MIPPSNDRLARAVEIMTGAVAMFGGFVMVLIAMLMVVSVIMRAIFNQPIDGDYEITELLAVIGVLAFFPYCQQVRGHIAVPTFVEAMPARTGYVLNLISEGIFAAILTVLTWRMAIGGFDVYHGQDVTMMLRIPLWWAYAVGAGFLALTTGVGLWRIYEIVRAGP